MKNLAGREDADKEIRDELTRAGIEIVEVEKSKGEVPYTLEGKLGGFTFKRSWYYWTVNGLVPLHIAKNLYDHPEGKVSIRVDGHCDRPPPEDPWITWADKDGYELGRLSEWDKYRGVNTALWDMVDRETMISKHSKIRWVSDREKKGMPYISLYHIDTQAGLLLFCRDYKR